MYIAKKKKKTWQIAGGIIIVKSLPRIIFCYLLFIIIKIYVRLRKIGYVGHPCIRVAVIRVSCYFRRHLNIIILTRVWRLYHFVRPCVWPTSERLLPTTFPNPFASRKHNSVIENDIISVLQATKDHHCNGRK